VLHAVTVGNTAGRAGGGRTRVTIQGLDHKET